MPFIDLQSKLGFDVDRWMLIQSGKQPLSRPARCHAFEKEYIECAHGIGQTRALRECKVEMEDFYECVHRDKTFRRLQAIKQQRDKLIKENAYTPPPHHTGHTEA
ncbi:NADH dehydrogenase [ubiquinone] iron-sulfur protein 5 [Astyanax mexicanus]|uniref:NADH dehydrogenase [ubiquinone] iron-sulfur protein 5 n=1 Tax=Astyanax mexicanus TaxID=7994 RepID=A0A8B9HVK5_ASTMX|nr:NADH dehydrogenase [ubiquinone] iron-sulfur protein 5 [Astyanax mexicanus]XP_007258896.1 NADH dehydrogenase [ubiquinone] iron-sulfur protein 5 [Astyanax mexicanus]KAG9279766.1 NADH dehydrogenase ubiquinone iron-sulfur protein 5 [Astyanax mexicanus]